MPALPCAGLVPVIYRRELNNLPDRKHADDLLERKKLLLSCKTAEFYCGCLQTACHDAMSKIKKSQRLQVVVDLREEQEKKALQALGECQSRHLEMQTQLENLYNYRREYQQQYQELAHSGACIRKLLDFRAFIGKLDQAVQAQQQQLQVALNELQEQRRKWQAAHRQTLSMHKIHDAALLEEQQLLQKREQQEMDEHAQRSGNNDGMDNA